MFDALSSWIAGLITTDDRPTPAVSAEESGSIRDTVQVVSAGGLREPCHPASPGIAATC